MTLAARREQRPFVTIAEFDAFLDRIDASGATDVDYDLLGGEIVMMSNPNRRHGIIVKNIVKRLAPAMDDRGCETYSGDMRIQIDADPAGGDKPKPDIVVRCGATPITEETRTYITDPIVAIEVLSPSTESTDVFRKTPFYMSVPTMRHVVIVHQDERRIEHWRRATANDEWTKVALPREGERLSLEAVAFDITLDEVYATIASLAPPAA